MKCYVYKTNTILSPFGDDISEAQVMLETLAETQERACRKHKLELSRIDDLSQASERPCVLAPDYLYFSEKALGDFLKTARKHKIPGAVLALKRCHSVEHVLPLQDVVLQDWEEGRGRVVYDMWLVPEGPLPDQPDQLREALKERCPPLTVPMREISIPIRMPVVDQEKKFFMYPITSTVCCHISHWTHLLWLSQLAFGTAWMELLRNRTAWTLLKALGAVFRKFSFNKWKLLSHMNRKGKGCDIHPTAYLEGCILGDNVKIGAGACLYNTMLGDNVIVGDHAKIINCVIGENCYLAENFFLVTSLAYPGSTLGNVRCQMSVFGRDVFLHGWCSLVDAKFVGDVQVMHKGKRVGTGRSFMASCVGHRAILGAKILIHPGREIPNDLLMVSHPDDVIVEIPGDVPPNTPMVRDKGTLVTLESLKAKK